VRALCDKYDLPYTTGSFLVQYGKTWRTIAKLSLPDRFLHDTADDAAETRSEKMFAALEAEVTATEPSTGRHRGLKTAIAAVGRGPRNRTGRRRRSSPSIPATHR
jgi:NADPH-dependent stearoyl-CoA 9-desaturase